MVSPFEMRRRCSALLPAFSSTMPKSICAGTGLREEHGYGIDKPLRPIAPAEGRSQCSNAVMWFAHCMQGYLTEMLHRHILAQF